MSVNLRPPNITGATDHEQLAQIRRYLFSLTEQLQWAFNTISTPNANQTVVQKISSVPAASQVAPLSLEENFEPEVAFDALKPLIIKSADIVEAYYEAIKSRISGLYVAESDFGTFTEQTEFELEQTSTGIEQTYTNIQTILSEIKNINFTLAEVNAHIHSGLLYYDEAGLPVYGVEVGQKNTVDGVEVFRKYARFTSNRLSFYDQNDTEVAYVSDYKLYITDVFIKGSLTGNAFRLDFTKGFRLKYVGRG